MSNLINGNVGIVTFVAEHDYPPQEQGEIELHKGDLCVVAKPIVDPNGWLMGTNKNTGEHGQFPGTFVSIVEDYTPPPPPPRPPKPDRAPRLSKDEIWKDIMVNNHKMEKVTFVKPVWCPECRDYIWGIKQSCFWCSECFFASHPGCSHYFNKVKCSPDRKYMFDYDKSDLLRPVEHWDNLEVLTWLASIRAYQYIHVFKEKGIVGGSLYDIDEAYLKKVLAIPHDFDVRTLSNSIRELIKGTNPVEKNNPAVPSTEEPDENFLDKARDAIESHKLREHTFTTIQTCDICRKCLFGLVRQGLLCAACGVQCHRYCAQYGLVQCKQKYVRSRRTSESQEPHFGEDLSDLGGSIPVCIEKLAIAVEEKAATTKDLYLTAVPFHEFLSLRNALNQAPTSVTMRGEEWRNPHMGASLLKQYLLEMPSSVIPPDKYENFIILAKLSQSATLGGSKQQLASKINELPRLNRDLLIFLQAHLKRTCRACDSATMDRIFTVFSVLILRPDESEARELIKNLDHQKYVVELLFSGNAVIDRKPSVPGRLPTPVAPSSDSSNLDGAEWYWGPISRAAASDKLKNTQDGTFLVRDSQKKGEYTLSLRKDGGNKLIKIYKDKDGGVGFTDSTTFPSLFALIEHFFVHSLQEYNSSLDIKLLYPVSKYENLPDIPVNEIEQQLEEVSTKMGQFTTLETRLVEASKEVEDVMVLLEAQAEVILILEEHISLARNYMKEVAPNDRASLQNTITHMDERLINEKRALKDIDDLFKQKNDENSLLEKCLNDMKYEMPEIENKYNELQRKLKDYNPDRAKQFNAREDEGIYDELPALSYAREVDELPQESWLLGKVSRGDVRRFLNGKPDGTFFVRDSERKPGQFVISLVHDQSIKHVPIEKSAKGYGFAEPYNIYPDLKSLVHHYHKQSLKMHNPVLDTTLMFPIRYIEDDDNIYMAYAGRGI